MQHIARYALLLPLLGCTGSPDAPSDGGTHPPLADGGRTDAPPIPWDGGPVFLGPWTDPDHPPDEPAPPGPTYSRVASPGRDMHFTTGLPVRIFADAPDQNAYMDGHFYTARQVRFYVDGVQIASVDRVPDVFGYYEAWTDGLAVGDHMLTLQATNTDGSVVDSYVGQIIHVDPMPVHATTMSLTADLVLSGASDLVLDDVSLIGNGFRIVATDFSGRLIIRNSFVTGLGSLGMNGIDLTTSGDVLLSNTIFEHTAPIQIAFQSTGSLSMQGCEVRANNLIVFVPDNPDAGDILDVIGSSGHVVAGTRFGAGQIEIARASNVTFGGDTDAQSNIVLGPRGVIYLNQCSDSVVRGNYDHHGYVYGWSQGYNLRFYQSSGILSEHNVVFFGSWPVEEPPGELRYNLIVEAGHEWIRSPQTGLLIHHNVFLNSDVGGDPASGISAQTAGITGIQVFNNTFLGGHLPTPAVGLGWGGAAYASVRSNFFTGFEPMRFDDLGAVIGRDIFDTSDQSGRIAYADYNCFATPGERHYDPLVVAAHNVGDDGFGGHDCSSGDVDALLANAVRWPFPVPEGELWNGQVHVSEILAAYRVWLSPLAGSPLIDAGDPADGDTIDIGAIESEAGSAHPADHFGRFGAP